MSHYLHLPRPATLRKQQIGGIAVEMRLFRAVVECKIIDHKPDRYTEEELGIREISIINICLK
jgi:hypothetical protein